MPLPYDPRPAPSTSNPTNEVAPPPAPPTSAPPPAAIAPVTPTAPPPRFAQPAAIERPRVNIEGQAVARYGDRAGEWLRMERGRFDAWIHVGLAFVAQVAMIGGVLGGLAAALVTLFGGTDRAATVLLAVGVPTGGVGAWFTFRDRWRCIEAFSSRWCSGMMNLSVLYVPAIAFVYANVRGVQKIVGR